MSRSTSFFRTTLVFSSRSPKILLSSLSLVPSLLSSIFSISLILLSLFSPLAVSLRDCDLMLSPETVVPPPESDLSSPETTTNQVAKKTAQRSKTILTNIERRQKGVAATDVFGVQIEVTVQRQESNRPLPHVLVKCADYLVLSGLSTEYLFKYEGDKKTIQQLISIFNEDWNASLPVGVTPHDVASLTKCYLASLPEPLTTFMLYQEIRDARSSIRSMRNILKKLPNVNYMTLEFITALLLRVTQKALLNKMDARSLAMEIAPLIIWQKGQRPDYFDQYSQHLTSVASKKTMDASPTYSAWDTLSEEDDNADASSAIPLDDGRPTDFGAIEVVQCLIEHHNAIFTDANETVWR